MNISKLNDKQFSLLWQKLAEKIKEDPIENFVKAAGFIDFEPSPAQEVILKTIFGKVLDPTSTKKVLIEVPTKDRDFDLEEVEMTEVELYEFLTESKYNPDNIKEAKINKINLICGRRSGKTTLSAIIAIYCAIITNWKPFLKKTPFATVLILSHSREFSDEVLEMIRTFIESSDILSRLINKEKKNTTSAMNLKVPWVLKDGLIQWSRVQIKVAAASSKTTRGVAACSVLCDEIAFWNLEENMKETDAKIMKAVRPAMKQFGKLGMLIKLSSPGIKQGILYGEYKSHKSGKLPESYAVFKAPTWMMNNIIPKEELIEEHKLDPDAFDQEYRSNFTDSLSNFILPEFVDMAVLKNIPFQAPEHDGSKYYAAIDAAYKGDRFTFCVVTFKDNRVKQYVSKGWEGSKKQPVSAYEVAEYIRVICKQYGIDSVAADQYSFQPLKEIFSKFDIQLEEYTFTPIFKKKIYFNLKKLVHSQQIDLLDNEIQTRETKELMVEQTPNGLIRIGHPAGGSDDFATSLAISCFLATEGVTIGQFSFETTSASKTYGVEVDSHGRAFTAPSVDLLVQSGHLPGSISDNSDLYEKHPETGKLVRKGDIDDGEPDDGTNFAF